MSNSLADFIDRFTSDNLDLDSPKDFFIFSKPELIHISGRVKTVIERIIPKKELKEIDKDAEVAIEKIYLLLSNLSSHFHYEREDQWKSLHSKIMHEQLGKIDEQKTYSRILKLLLKGTPKTGAIIETKTLQDGTPDYKKGSHSKAYRYTDYFSKGDLVTFTLKNKTLVNRRMKISQSYLKACINNRIGDALIHWCESYKFSTIEIIEAEADRLIALGYRDSKGRLLTRLGKNSKDHWKDASKRCFVEDHIKIFKYLTANGLMIPKIGSERSGFRVYDSINLMPRWIRNLMQIDNEKVFEVDLVCLHPNICLSIYGGSIDRLTHQDVASYLEIGLIEAKQFHLAFFNQERWMMKQNPIFKFYEDNEPEMLERILKDKLENSYTSTSKKIFKIEVEIMSEVIVVLKANDIRAAYVFDALLCKSCDIPFVIETIEAILEKYNVKTTCKYK